MSNDRTNQILYTVQCVFYFNEIKLLITCAYNFQHNGDHHSPSTAFPVLKEPGSNLCADWSKI